HPSRSAADGKRPARTAARQRDHRNADGHGRSRRRECPSRPCGAAAPDAGVRMKRAATVASDLREKMAPGASTSGSLEPLRGAKAPGNSAGGGAPRAVENVGPVMRALARAIDGLELPAVEKISEAQEENPFQVLIATLLSARTQDQTTLAASTRLFAAARTPRTMAKLTVKRIERLIYPVSFYRHKARHVKATCQILVDRFGGRVPATMVAMVSLPG